MSCGYVWLRTLSLGALLFSITAGMLLPIYTDEVGWRFQERAALDGFDVTYNDLCGSNTIAQPPWFMMPVRWFSATMNQAFADPFYIRLSGVLCALLWLGLVLLMTRRLQPDSARRHLHQALAFALLGLGMLPFQLVLSRPEQPMLLMTALIILNALVAPSGTQFGVIAWLKTLTTILLCLVALSYHVKGVLVAGIAVVALLVGSWRREATLPRIAGIAAVVPLAVVSAMYWVRRFQCVGVSSEGPNDNVIVALANGALDAGMLFPAATGLLPPRYAVLAKFAVRPESAWAPPGSFGPLLEATSAGVLLLLWTLGTGFAVVQLGALAAKERHRVLFHPKAVLALAVIGSTSIWGVSQIGRHFYEAAFVLPMLVLFVLLCLSLPRGPARLQPLLPMLVSATVGISLLSQTILLSASYPALLQAARSSGSPANQAYSVSILGYSEVRRDIRRAMTASGFPENVQLNRLMVDDLSYLALQKSRLPLYDIGVVGGWPRRIDDPVGYLLSRGSEGVVVGCVKLPAHMLMAASRSGSICALSRADLIRLSEGAEAEPHHQGNYRQ